MNDPTYLEPSQVQGAALFANPRPGPVVMLNLLRFRDLADYTAHPQLAPTAPITGRAAYERYIDHTRPFLQEAGGEILFMATCTRYLIGPEHELWDAALLVRQTSLADFLKFASHDGYLAGLGHRVAALRDSRLLPLFPEAESAPRARSERADRSP